MCACIPASIRRLGLGHAVPDPPRQLFSWVNCGLRRLAAELARPGDLPHLSRSKAYVRFDVGQHEPHPLRQLGLLEGSVYFWHAQGGQAGPLLYCHSGELLSEFLNFSGLRRQPLLG